MALPSLDDRAIARLGWTATLGSIAMYVAYIDQIARNLHGDKGSVIQPACAAGCALLWMCYGLMRRDRDWPIVIANLPGVLLAGTTVVTAFT